MPPIWWPLFQQPAQSRAAGKAAVSRKGLVAMCRGSANSTLLTLPLQLLKAPRVPADDSGLRTFPSSQSKQNYLPWAGEMAQCLSGSCVNVRTWVRSSRTDGNAKWAWQPTCNSSPGRQKQEIPRASCLWKVAIWVSSGPD